MDFGTPCPDVIIPSGTDVSGVVEGKYIYNDALSIQLFGPNGLDAHTFVIQVTNEEDATAGSTWFTLQINDPPTDLQAPAANKSRTYYDLCGYPAFRIKDNTGNVAADRTFKMTRKVRV